MHRYARPAAAGMVLLSSCASTTPAGQSLTDAAGTEETRVFLEQTCPFTAANGETEEIAPLAPVVTALIGFGVNETATFVSNKLSEAANPKDFPVYGYTAGWLWFFNPASKQRELNKQIGCLVIVHGKFGSSSVDHTDQNRFDPLWIQKLATNNEVASWGLQQTPDFYFEAGVTRTSDNTYFRLRPLLLEYRNTFDHSMWGNKRDLVINISFSLPDATNTGKAFALTTFPAPHLTAPFRMIYGAKAYSPAWMPLPAPGVDVTQETSEYLKSAPSLTADTKTNMQPLNVEAQVIETREASEVLKALSAAFTSSSPALTTAATSVLDPASIASRQATATTAAQTANSAYATALNDYITKLGAYEAASTSPLVTRQRLWDSASVSEQSLDLATKQARAASVPIAAQPADLGPRPTS